MPPRLHRRGRIWYASYYVAGVRVRESTHCTDKRAAEAAARQLERDAADPARVSAQTTVEEACQCLLTDRRARGRSAATLRYYDQKVGHLARILGPSTLLIQITARTVDAYIRQRLDEEASRHTVAKELGALRSALKLARRRGDYHRDPAEVLPGGWSAEYRPRTRSLGRAELGKLLAELAPTRAAQVAFIVATGARWSEAVSARREDIDLRRRMVTLRGTKTELSARVVPILPHVLDLAQRAVGGAARQGPSYPHWQNVRRDIAAACVRAGIDRCSPNDLRRTASGWLVQRGAPSNLVGQFMGHADGRMVERVYGRLTPAQLGVALGTHVGHRVASGGVRSRRSQSRKAAKTA